MRFGALFSYESLSILFVISPSPLSFGGLKLPIQLLGSRWMSEDFIEHVDNGIFIGGMFRFVYKRDCCCFSYSCSSSPFNFRHLRRKQ